MICKNEAILKNIILLIPLFFFLSVVHCEKNWFFQYGNSKQNIFQSIAEIPDKGYVLVGNSNTLGSGKNDLWIVRLDQNLKFQWQRYFGGAEDDFGKDIIFSNDSFIVLAQKNEPNKKNTWLLKLNSSGDIMWSRTYGDSKEDIAHSIKKIKDKGFLITGVKTTINKGQQGWIMLINENGDMILEKSFGGAGNDGFYDGIHTLNGEFILIGYTNSINNTGLKAPKTSFINRIKKLFSPPKPSQEIWVTRLNEKGEVIWNKSYGGKDMDTGKVIYENKDSSLVIIGDTRSFGNAKGDAWVIKTEKSGYEIWNNTFGGKEEENVKNALFLNNGKILLSVNSNSSDKLLKGKNKNYYTRQILLNKKGNQLWENNYSQDVQNEINSNYLNRENDIINVGYHLIDNKKDLKRISSKWEGFSEQSINSKIKKGWIYKTDIEGMKTEEMFFNGDLFESISKTIIDKEFNVHILGNINAYNTNQEDMILLQYNSSGSFENYQPFIKPETQIAKSFYKKSDGGIVLIGDEQSTFSYGLDILVKSFDRNGNIMWDNTYGSLGNDVGFDVIESESGTIIVGKTNSFGNGGNDGWVLGLNSLGKEQWSKAYGGEGFDEFSAIRRLRDGNFVVTGTKASGMNGDDIWLMNIDDKGNDLWSKTYGGSLNEKGVETIISTNMDMLTVGVYQNNLSGKGDDIIVFRTNEFGEQLWSKTISMDMNQTPHAICEVQNGAGFVIVGETQTELLGFESILLIRINTLGDLIWDKSFGESYCSRGVSIADDGSGLIISGDIDLDANGNSDMFFLKTDYAGKIIEKNN